jgi:hypothetical protein
MDSIFCKTTSISISTFDSSENKRIINSKEITIEDFLKKILMTGKFQRLKKTRFLKPIPQ